MEYILCIIGIVVLSVVMICLVISALCVNAVFGKRCEGDKNFKYFTAEDYPDLNAVKVEIPTKKNTKKKSDSLLTGYIYSCGNCDEDKGIIIFSHGMGAGHFAYTGLIREFCLKGYKVLGFDNTGTVLSSGGCLMGMPRGAVDLCSAIDFVTARDEFKNSDVFLMGHSWGGASVCRALGRRSGIKAAAVFSPYNNEFKLLCSSAARQAGSKAASAVGFFLSLGAFIDFGTLALRHNVSYLKKSGVPVLAFHGDADESVELKNSVAYAAEKMGLSNVEAVILKGRGHNVYQTAESEKYLSEVFAKAQNIEAVYKGNIRKDVYDDFFGRIDYELMTRIDSDIVEKTDKFFSESK